CRFHPAEVEVPHRSDFGTPCCLRPTAVGSALGSRPFEATLRLLLLRPGDSWSPQGRSCRWASELLRVWTPRQPAIQTTRLVTFAPAGLSPAEHTSLYRSQLPNGPIFPGIHSDWKVIDSA